MSRIHSLSSETINKIAAGEVIESPASCIKELVENAIDAKPTEIHITLEDSGFKSLTVSDNGIGMSLDDMHLCMKRHATSKIRSASDLFSIQTMGFRGEALAAISSISCVRLTSKDASSRVGQCLEFKAGNLLSQSPIACERGTRIEVEDLFFNTPVRKAFQKSKASELGKIIKLVRKLALSQPEISFTLDSEKDRLLETIALPSELSSDPLVHRIIDLFEPDYLEESLSIDIDLPEMKLKGFIKDPAFSNPTRSKEFLFLNRRCVECKPISEAVRSGLSVSLPEGRFPSYCLYLEIASDEVDVNIHPQKKEVKLRSPAKLKEAIASAISAELSRKTQRSYVYNQSAASKSGFIPLENSSTYNLESPKPVAFEVAHLEFDKGYARIINSLFIGSYALLEIEVNHSVLDCPVVCDLKALSRALAYEAIKNRSLLKEKKLISKTLSLPHEAMRFVERNLSLFSELGCTLRMIGRSSILIDEMPRQLNEPVIEDLIQSVIDFGLESEESGTAFSIDKIQTMIAKKIAKKNAHTYPSQACDKRIFIEDAIKNSLPAFCPDKKPLFVYINEEEIEKLMQPNKAIQLPNEHSIKTHT